MGRPPKAEESKKSFQISIRMAPAVRDEIVLKFGAIQAFFDKIILSEIAAAQALAESQEIEEMRKAFGDDLESAEEKLARLQKALEAEKRKKLFS